MTRSHVVAFLFISIILLGRSFHAAEAADTPRAETFKTPGKITSALSAALERLQSPDPLSSPGASGSRAKLDEEGRLHVYIYLTSFSPETLKALKDQDVKVVLYDPDQRLVSARAKPEAIHDLATLRFVRLIDLPIIGHTR